MLKVGLTYDLRSDYINLGYTDEEIAEFDSEETIEALDETITELGYTTQRIGNIFSLVDRISKGERWDLVFNICEGIHGIGREAQVPALLDAYSIPYVFSDPMVLALTLHKGQTKRVIRDCDIPTADFAIIESVSDIYNIQLPFPLFAKPVAEGTGKGIDGKSRIFSLSELEQVCHTLLNKYKQPVLIETYLPGREFTVGIVGTGENAKAIGVMEIIITPKAKEQTYSYHTKENWRGIVEYSIIKGEMEAVCSETAIKAWRCLGCRDGGRVDIKLDSAGIPNFIEVNPLAGLNPSHSDLPMLARYNGINYHQLIKLILDSAMLRQNR